MLFFYSNFYSVVMSSLGYQVMYRFFNEYLDVVCERFVLFDDVVEFRW